MDKKLFVIMRNHMTTTEVFSNRDKAEVECAAYNQTRKPGTNLWNVYEIMKPAESKLDEMRKALEAIKKHMEIASPTGYKLSTVWFIADKTLNSTVKP